MNYDYGEMVFLEYDGIPWWVIRYYGDVNDNDDYEVVNACGERLMVCGSILITP